MNLFADLLTFLGQDRSQHFLQETPLDFFNELHNIKFQSQCLRHIFLLESENVRDDMFVINVNATELHFGLKEFVAKTSLKSGSLSDFVSDPCIPIIYTNFIKNYNFI